MPPGPPTGPIPPTPPLSSAAAGEPPTGPPPVGARSAAPWAAPSGPVEPDADADAARRRPRWQVAVAGLGVLALVAGLLVAFIGGDDEPTATPVPERLDEPDAPATTAVPSTTTPPPPATPEELDAVVAELSTFVSETRGLPFLRPVEVELLADADFEARLLEDFIEDEQEIADVEVFYRALGLLQGEASLLDTLRGIYSTGVLGFYDPETDELVVRGAGLTPYVRQTIVHELVHALDDQHAELHRPEYDYRKDEIATGFTAVVEGNARRVEDAWLGEQPAAFRAEAEAQEQSFAAGIDVEAFPEILLFQIGAPYELGELFVAHLLRGGGERAVDAALASPPDTSEQFLFPQRFDAREPRIEVPVPPADGEVVDDGVVGALFLFGLLTTGGSDVGPGEAFAAVDGWGGDWAVTWRAGDQACVRIDVVGDTPADTDEIRSALTTWADERPTVTVGEADGRVRVESCSPAGGASSPQV